MAHLNLYLLGSPRVELDDQEVVLSRRKVLAPLIYLAVTRQRQRRDSLATLFWPDSGQEAARASLRRELYTLTTALGDGWVISDREQVALTDKAAIGVDVEGFRQHLAAVRTHGHAPDEVCAACLEPLTAAVALYQGDFLAGFTLSDCPEFDDWQFFHTDSLRRELTGALEKLVRLHRERGEYETAISYARRWLLVDALHEPVHRLLMQLYAWAGQQAAALRQYQECVRLLNEELGVEPEPETAAIFEAIRARRFPEPAKQTRRPGDGETGGQRATSAPSPNYPITQSPPSAEPVSKPHNLPPQPTPFIGREQEVAAIVARIADPACRLLTLVGPGGMGKTRLALQAAQSILDASNTADSAHHPPATIHQPRFDDGLFFVPLDAVQTPSGICTAIADALGLRLVGNAPPQQQVVEYLRSRRLLTDCADYQSAATHLVTALAIGHQLQFPRLMLEALCGLARRQLTTPSQPAGQQEPMLTWLRLIVAHPASDRFSRQRASALLAACEPLTGPVIPSEDATDLLESIVTNIIAGTDGNKRGLMPYQSPPNPQLYYEQVWTLVRQIPYGKVATYGQIAQMIPPPSGMAPQEYKAFSPRWVGDAMAACPNDVPWQRVINAQGKISERPGAQRQRQRLEEEGIVFVNDRVDLKIYQWQGFDREDDSQQTTLF